MDHVEHTERWCSPLASTTFFFPASERGGLGGWPKPVFQHPAEGNNGPHTLKVALFRLAPVQLLVLDPMFVPIVHESMDQEIPASSAVKLIAAVSFPLLIVNVYWA